MKVEYFHGWHRIEDIGGSVDAWYWCTNTFGESNPNGPWFFMGEYYHFKSEKDATMFLLRWAK